LGRQRAQILSQRYDKVFGPLAADAHFPASLLSRAVPSSPKPPAMQSAATASVGSHVVARVNLSARAAGRGRAAVAVGARGGRGRAFASRGGVVRVAAADDGFKSLNVTKPNIVNSLVR